MEILISLTVLVFSAILHEIAHGLVADRLGDPTARLSGRLTLDPRPHIDLNMTIIVPLLAFFLSGGRFIIGGAKPVPVDPFNLKDGNKDVALVSLAGPLTNLLLAAAGASLIKLIFYTPVVAVIPPILYEPLYRLFETIVNINLMLGIFNLIPVPPLDGSKIVAMLLPEETAMKYLSIGSFGITVIILLLYMSPLGSILSNLITLGRTLLLP